MLPGEGAFEIDSISGAIITTQPLDREKVAEYELTVVAKDKGNPMKQTSAKVKVTVLDVLDSSPVFEKKVYLVNVLENVKPHTQILTVSAKSPDLNPPGLIYDLEFEGLSQVFSIDPRSGRIQTTSKRLDYEVRSEYIFKVRATASPYFGEATVNVTLVDVNDNSPVLDDFFMLINVREGHMPARPRYKIPAFDPDVSDKLTFKLLFGNDRNWVELNATSGELYVSPTLINTMKPLTIGVQVSDGSNYDSANGSIVLTAVTEEMLNSSVAISIVDMEIEVFLNSGFDRLVKSIAKVVNCNPSQVLIFHMKVDTSQNTGSDDEDVNTTLKIWLVIRLKNAKGLFYGFFDPQYVRDAMYLHLAEISKDSGLKLLPFEDDICVKEVCSYGKSKKDCFTYAKFEEGTDVYNSRKVVFRTVPVKWLPSFRCICPVDYRTGSKNLCSTPINLCYSSPCGSNGKCVSTEKSYACVCNSGRTGVNCEINLAKDKCPSDSDSKLSKAMATSPCKSESTCVNSGPGGLSCKCKESQETDTKFCELTTRSFQGNSFVAYSGMLHCQFFFRP